MTRVSLLVAALAVLVPMIGCGGSSGRVAVRREFRVDFTPAQQRELKAAASEEYQLRHGDILAIRDIFNENLAQDNVMILPDGTATFLGVERFRVAGMTITELDSVLTASYAQRFLDPSIDVYLMETSSRKVYVLGEVRMPGGYPHDGPGFNVISAIAAAGGYTEHAQSGAIALIRMTPSGYSCRELDLRSINKGYEFDPGILDLQPFDIVYVSRSAIGDFAVFSTSLMGALMKYTDIASDLRYLSDSDPYRR